MKPAFLLLILILSLSLMSCQNIPTRYSSDDNNQSIAQDTHERDPLESFNRSVFAFNDFVDQNFLLPIAKGYKHITPEEFREMVSNFFDNLQMPFTLINDLLQLKPIQFSKDLMRFVINSTVGLFGLLDPAEYMGLGGHQEDLGQTFAFWGWQDGDYLMLPFLGPSTTTDALGQVITWSQLETLDLQSRLIKANDIPVAYPFLLQIVNLRAGLIDQEKLIFGEDRYAFIRSAYLQRRLFDIYDGNPPMTIEEDFGNEVLPDWLEE